MPPAASRTVKVDIASRIEMLEMVQSVLVHVSSWAGFEEEACHYMSVAIRESVVNAIKHGNRGDASRRVGISFRIDADVLSVEVSDQGKGFDPGGVGDPLAEENLLKADGRGIFFMRSFMDEVSYLFPKRGGTTVRMVKRLVAAPAP